MKENRLLEKGFVKFNLNTQASTNLTQTKIFKFKDYTVYHGKMPNIIPMHINIFDHSAKESKFNLSLIDIIKSKMRH